MQIDTVTFTFEGHLPQASFSEFAQHRAAHLSLQLDAIAQKTTISTFRVQGPADLLDAFEMAMSLGPRDCVVTRVTRAGHRGPIITTGD